MRDSYINAMNVQKTTVHWMNAISENLVNLYTPGYRENMVTFKTYLDAAVPDTVAVPGTAAAGTVVDRLPGIRCSRA